MAIPTPFKNGSFSGVGIRKSTADPDINYFIDVGIKEKLMSFYIIPQDPSSTPNILNYRYYFLGNQIGNELRLKVELIEESSGGILEGNGAYNCNDSKCTLHWSANLIYNNVPSILKVTEEFSCEKNPITAEDFFYRNNSFVLENDTGKFSASYTDKSIWMNDPR